MWLTQVKSMGSPQKYKFIQTKTNHPPPILDFICVCICNNDSSSIPKGIKNQRKRIESSRDSRVEARVIAWLVFTLKLRRVRAQSNFGKWLV